MGNELRQELVIGTGSAFAALRDFLDKGIEGLRRAFSGSDTRVEIQTADAVAALDKVEAEAQLISREMPVWEPIIETDPARVALREVDTEVEKINKELEHPHVFGVDAGDSAPKLHQTGEAAHHAAEGAEHAHGPFGHLKELFVEGLGTGAAILGLQGIASAIEGSFEKFESAEKAEIQLEGAFRDTGSAAKKNVEDMKEWAMQQEKTTGVAHSSTERILALGKTLAGITDPEKLKEFAKVATDTAIALGKDPEMYVQSLAAKLEAGGKDRTLGITFKPGDAEGNIDKFMKNANYKFGGFAEEIGKTSAGGIAKFKASFTDLQESVGKIIASVLGPIAPVLGQLADTVGAVLGPIGAILAETFDAKGPVGKALASLVSSIGPILIPIVGLLGPILSSAMQILTPIIAAGGQLAAVLGPVITGIMVPLGQILGEVGGIVSSILVPALALVTSILNPLVQYVGMLITTALSLLAALLPLINIAFIPLKIVLEVLGQVMNALLPPIMQIAAQFNAFAQQLITQLKPVIDQITKLFEEQGAVISKLISGVLLLLIRVVIQITSTLLTMVAHMFGVKSASELFAKALEWVTRVVTGVVAWLYALRAEVAGVSAALSFAVGVISEFIDAITSLDVDKAKHSFDNFFERLGDAYEKGKAEFLRGQKPIDTPKTTEEEGEGDRPPPPPKPEGEKKDPLKFDTSNIDKDKRLAAQKAALDAETNEIRKILLKQSFDIINAQFDAADKVKKANDDATAARKKGTPVDMKSLTKFIKDANDNILIQSELARGEASKALQAAIPKFVKDITDIEIAALQEQAKTIEGITVTQRREIGRLTLEALVLQQQESRNAIIEKNENFKKDLQQLTADVSLGKILPEDAKAALDALYEKYRNSSEQLKNLQINQARELAAMKRKIEEDVESMRIEQIGDQYERDYARAVFEAERKLRVLFETLNKEEAADRDSLARLEITEEQFAANQREREKHRVQSAINAAIEIGKAQREYLEKTDFWYRASAIFRDSLDEAMLRNKATRTQKELTQEKAKLDLEEQFLKEKLDSDLINYTAYTNKLAQLAQARIKSEEGSENRWANTWASLRTRVADAFGKMSDAGGKLAMESSVKYADVGAHRIDTINRISKEKQDKGTAKDLADKEAAAETDGEIQKSRSAAYAATALQISASLVQFGIEGHKSFGQYTAMMLDTAFFSLKAMIPGWILGIFGSSVEQLGPVAGPVVAAGMTGLLYVLLSVAESGMTKGQGYRSGGKVTGGRQRITVNDDPQSKPEYVIHGEATDEYESTLDAINRRASIGDILQTLLPRVNMQAVWTEASNGYGPAVRSIMTPVAGTSVVAVDPSAPTRAYQKQTEALISTTNAQHARESALLRGKVDTLVHETRKVVRNTGPKPKSKRSGASAGAALW